MLLLGKCKINFDLHSTFPSFLSAPDKNADYFNPHSRNFASVSVIQVTDHAPEDH